MATRTPFAPKPVPAVNPPSSPVSTQPKSTPAPIVPPASTHPTTTSIPITRRRSGVAFSPSPPPSHSPNPASSPQRHNVSFAAEPEPCSPRNETYVGSLRENCSMLNYHLAQSPGFVPPHMLAFNDRPAPSMARSVDKRKPPAWL